MFETLAAATLAATPALVPIAYDLPPAQPETHTVEIPAAAPEDPMPGLYRIGKDKWTSDKQWADRVKRSKVRRVIYHALNVADLATTLICLEGRKDTCEESNPIYGQSTARVVVGKVATSVIYEVLRDPEGDGEVFEWIAIGILGAVVGNNISVVF